MSEPRDATVSGPAGLDLAALGGWLDAQHPGLRRGPLRASRLTGGLSNLTYEVTDGVSRWALRRPPLGHVLPTAHDMTREYRFLTALAGTAVPVAAPFALCEDAAVLGAPFYLMAFVDGVVLDRPGVLAGLSPASAGRACDLLVDTLLELHAVDPRAESLAGLGRPDGFLERQVRRWTAQWTASQTRPRPQVEQLTRAMAARVPAPSAPGVVHGDYRLTNIIYGPGAGGGVDRIAAVVDWEMATVGDPLTDVGLLVVYQRLGTDGGFVMPRFDVARGFATAGDLVARYAGGSRRDLSDVAWYVALGWFKLAVIAEGIHARYLQGLTVGGGFDGVGASVPHLLDSGLAALHGEAI